MKPCVTACIFRVFFVLLAVLDFSKTYFLGAQMYKDPNDGMTYEWDISKRAWFPKINEDFLAQYQMNYGFTKDGVAEPTKPEEPTVENGKLDFCEISR